MNRLLLKDTYHAMLRGSIGSRMFQHLFQEQEGIQKDILADGTISCAFFVSSILFHFSLIESVHATISGTERDMVLNGWYLVDEPEEGDVLIWEDAAQHGGEIHGRIGFYMGENRAISHSDKERTPVEHHFTFEDTRKIIKIYSHHFLEKN